jgi:hypothetical protein
VRAAHAAGAPVVMALDLLQLTGDTEERMD